MANTRSAKKRIRSANRKRGRNRATRSSVKTVVSRARKVRPAAGSPFAAEEFRRAISGLDRAAEKGVLHRNNAARRKSRLMRALAKLAPAAAQPPARTKSPTRRRQTKPET